MGTLSTVSMMKGPLSAGPVRDCPVQRLFRPVAHQAAESQQQTACTYRTIVAGAGVAALSAPFTIQRACVPEPTLASAKIAATGWVARLYRKRRQIGSHTSPGHDCP